MCISIRKSVAYQFQKNFIYWKKSCTEGKWEKHCDDWMKAKKKKKQKNNTLPIEMCVSFRFVWKSLTEKNATYTECMEGKEKKHTPFKIQSKSQFSLRKCVNIMMKRKTQRNEEKKKTTDGKYIKLWWRWRKGKKFERHGVKRGEKRNRSEIERIRLYNLCGINYWGNSIFPSCQLRWWKTKHDFFRSIHIHGLVEKSRSFFFSLW